MGRLANLKPSLATLAPRLGYQPGDEQARNRQRAGTQPWRQWYKSPRWAKLRKKVLLRDMYTCQKTGVLCFEKSPGPRSPIVDHKVPHHGNPALFWDENNLQCLSKEAHDKLKQIEEQTRPRG